MCELCSRVASFLGKEVPDEAMPKLLDFLSFDKMKKNPAANKSDIIDVSNPLINPVRKFLKQATHRNISCFVSDYQAGKTTAALSEESLRQRNILSQEFKLDGEGCFMRKGETGNWRKHFTPGMEDRFLQWEAKWLEGSDLKFTYDL